jgi:2-iminobutanoate/2-iminopropanoate deaminase
MIERMMTPGSFWNAPFSHACRAGNFLFVTGQMPVDPATGLYVEKDISVQSRRVMENLAMVLQHAGMSFSDVVSARAFLTNMEDHEAFNKAYVEYVKDGLPSRTTIGVTGLAGGALVEIDLVAYKES